MSSGTGTNPITNPITDPITIPMDTDEVPPTPPYKPNVKATDTVEGMFFGVVVPKGHFATVAGLCEKWDANQKKLVAAYRLVRKKEEEKWAKKNYCCPKTKICPPKPTCPPKKARASTSCGCS